VRGIAEGEGIRVVRSEERNDIATADAEAVERPRIAVNGVQKVAGGDVSAAMPETGPVAGGLEPLHEALDIQGIGKYHRLLPTDGAAQPTVDNTMDGENALPSVARSSSVKLDTFCVRMNTCQDDPARTAEGAGRTAGIEIFAEEGMGKPPGATLGPPGFRCDEVAATGQEDNRPGRQAD
jgi:hypothetical protein